jgi:hypoxanthine phosphoribosyltransferase
MSINKKYYDYQQITEMVNDISFQMYKDNWRPDYIVGLTRGGLVPAVIMSNALGIPMETLKVSLRDSDSESESNLWMAEDAFGYDYPNEIVETHPTSIYGEEGQGKNILILDDINDTGATLDWIKQDWQSSCMPNSSKWLQVWGNNVRIAVLIDNLSSDFSGKVDYSAKEINKAEDDSWIVFPWER